MVVMRRAQTVEAAWMQAGFDRHMGWTKPAGHFAECCQLQERGEIVLLVAAEGDAYCGHVKVVWKPDYVYFRDNGIPEIQDLNVLPDYRRQGIGEGLVAAAEDVIRERSFVAGIGVGLYADYGTAQRMYTRRGYIPDGRGVMYDGQPVTPGQAYPVDDALILYLTRRL